jgi:hypothetical protein
MQHRAHHGRWLGLTVAVLAIALALPLAPDAGAARRGDHLVWVKATGKHHSKRKCRRRVVRKRHGHKRVVCIKARRNHKRTSPGAPAPSTPSATLPGIGPGGPAVGYGGAMWSVPVAPNAALDPMSPLLVNSLVGVVDKGYSSGQQPWITISGCSLPIFTVGPTQPTVKVSLSDPTAGWRQSLQSAFDAVPLPANAYASNCKDAKAAVVQPSTDRMWEFWHLHRDGSGWHADWGGATQHASLNTGSYGPNDWPGAAYYWGTTASSMTVTGGILRISEMQAGVVPHAIGLVLPDVRAGEWSWPAQRTDGGWNAPNSIPYGAHFRLDPTLNVEALNVPRATKILARAAQRYGMIVYDKTGSGISIPAEMAPPGQTNPWPSLLGETPGAILQAFPWNRLQLLRMDLRRTQGPASP